MTERSLTPSPFHSWRALARRGDGTEQVLTVGNSSTVVRSTYAEYFREELEDDEREIVVSILLQRWSGDAERGVWEERCPLRIPEFTKSAVRLAEPVPGNDREWDRPPIRDQELDSVQSSSDEPDEDAPAITARSQRQTEKPPREPRIGICVFFASNAVPPPAAVGERCAAAVRKAGGEPSLYSTQTDPSGLGDWIHSLDGLILIGDDRIMGVTTRSVRSVRIAAPFGSFERFWLQLWTANEKSLPFLAIGGALPFLNELAGGTSIDHIPTEVRNSLPHFERSYGPHRHMVKFEPDTCMADIYGVEELRVNSSHVQAVRTAASGFRVAARAPDGIIEAIETMDLDRFCVGVQWHPEEESASALDGQLFDSLLQAAGLPKSSSIVA